MPRIVGAHGLESLEYSEIAGKLAPGIAQASMVGIAGARRLGSPKHHRLGSPLHHHLGWLQHCNLMLLEHNRLGSPEHHRLGSLLIEHHRLGPADHLESLYSRTSLPGATGSFSPGVAKVSSPEEAGASSPGVSRSSSRWATAASLLGGSHLECARIPANQPLITTGQSYDFDNDGEHLFFILAIYAYDAGSPENEGLSDEEVTNRISPITSMPKVRR